MKGFIVEAIAQESDVRRPNVKRDATSADCVEMKTLRTRWSMHLTSPTRVEIPMVDIPSDHEDFEIDRRVTTTTRELKLNGIAARSRQDALYRVTTTLSQLFQIQLDR